MKLKHKLQIWSFLLIFFITIFLAVFGFIKLIEVIEDNIKNFIEDQYNECYNKRGLYNGKCSFL